MLVAAMGAGHWPWWLLSGIVMAAAFAPVALFGPRGVLAQFGVIAPALIFITALCTWSEAFIFMPTSDMQKHPFQMLKGSLVMYVIVAAVLAVLAANLKVNHESMTVPEHRTAGVAVLMVLVSGCAYALYYLVFGAITYQFFTKGYYPEAAKIAGNLGLWFWAIQIGRGVLMTLGILLLLYTLRMRRWQTAIIAGLVVWVAGGLAPLLPPNPYMGATQRFIHVVEIFTQNFSLGVTAALLIRRKQE
jgi:hypothetical protein